MIYLEFIGVFGFENRYYVNRQGMVITFRSSIKQVMKPTIERGGSHSITLWGDNRKKAKLAVSRMVAESYGLVPPGINKQYRILKKNGEPADNRLDNLVVRVNLDTDVSKCPIPIKTELLNEYLYCDVCRQYSLAENFTSYTTTMEKVKIYSSPCNKCNELYKNSPISSLTNKKSNKSHKSRKSKSISNKNLINKHIYTQEELDWEIGKGTKWMTMFSHSLKILK